MRLTSRYVAGVCDSDGCFALPPRVTVVGVYKPMLQQLQAQFGGRVSRHGDLGDGVWRWQVNGPDARALARLVLPHLQEKAPQAMMLLHYSKYGVASPVRAAMEKRIKDLKKRRFS